MINSTKCLYIMKCYIMHLRSAKYNVSFKSFDYLSMLSAIDIFKKYNMFYRSMHVDVCKLFSLYCVYYLSTYMACVNVYLSFRFIQLQNLIKSALTTNSYFKNIFKLPMYTSALNNTEASNILNNLIFLYGIYLGTLNQNLIVDETNQSFGYKLPVRISKYTVLRSPHADKKAREQFEIRSHKYIQSVGTLYNVSTLLDMQLPSGIGYSFTSKSFNY